MIQRINDIEDPRLDDYRNLTNSEKRGNQRERGTFIAEGRYVVRTLLTASRFRARSVLVTDPAYESLRDLLDRAESPSVFILSQPAMNAVAGFDIHRGCLAVGERGRMMTPTEVVTAARGARARPIVILEGVNNHDNIGSIFRNAGAFDAGAILLDPGCVDPLYRKAIRVSMGGSLRIPFAEFGMEDWKARLRPLHQAGYTTLALTPDANALDIRAFGSEHPMPEQVALLLGSEGDGLTREALAAADAKVRIPIAPGVDSLNVAATAGIALHRFASI